MPWPLHQEWLQLHRLIGFHLSSLEEFSMNKVCNVLGVICLVAGSSALASACVPIAAPEVDPGSAGSAIALVSGMVLLFGARRIRK